LTDDAHHELILRNVKMSKLDDLQRLMESGIVAVIRAESGDSLVEVARALSRGGVIAVEVTMTVPGAIRVIEHVSATLGDSVLLGAGTVLDAETARACLLAGAQFIVSPSTHRDVIELCRRYDKLVMPGALTPTEIIHAWQSGADLVKVFPSEFFGPTYLKAIRGPFPQVRLLPTGGVTLETANDFLACGASALGVGTSLVSPQMIKQREFDKIESLAQQFSQLVKNFRNKSRVASAT
jgi:2-dehydro-3-deoxyphosphogluconate aldolase / (4S)-4-hydroxy-2-oxoglutarate aldolase